MLARSPFVRRASEVLHAPTARWEPLFFAVSAIALLLFGARGGLGYPFNLISTPQIPSDARIMPFLTFGAVVIPCLFAEMARNSGRVWVRWAGPLAIGAALPAGTAGSIGVAQAGAPCRLYEDPRYALYALGCAAGAVPRR